MIRTRRRFSIPGFLPLAAGAVAALGMVGCNPVGPASLSAGRGVYNEVINRTEDEQVLNMIVRLRYGETFGMLSVASVTANIRAAATISGNFGIGPDESFAGNLVPLGIEGAYEENPTISYIPLGGESFVIDLLTPLSLTQAFLISRAAPGQQLLLRTLVSRVNGLDNPVKLESTSDEAFERVLTIVQDLVSRRKMSTVAWLEDDKPQYAVLIYDYADNDTALVKEYLRLLGLTSYSADGDDLRIPIRASLGRADGEHLNIEFRSVFDLIIEAGRTIEIPDDHLKRGIVEAGFHDSGSLRILSSRNRPRDASVAIPYEGWWFYIDRTDHASKRSYITLRTLIGMRLQDASSDLNAPELTIDVAS